MKSGRTMLILAGLVLLAVLPVIAQNTWNGSKLEVKFSAPTAFYAGDKKMPAGNYTVTQGAGLQANTMLIRGAGKNETYLEYQASVSQTPVTKTEVTLNRYGDKEYLNSIALPNGPNDQSSWILQATPSAGEQAAAKAAAAAKHTVPATSK